MQQQQQQQSGPTIKKEQVGPTVQLFRGWILVLSRYGCSLFVGLGNCGSCCCCWDFLLSVQPIYLSSGSLILPCFLLQFWMFWDCSNKRDGVVLVCKNLDRKMEFSSVLKTHTVVVVVVVLSLRSSCDISSIITEEIFISFLLDAA